jgi:hypothetical protein
MSDITVKFGAQDENLSDTLTRIQSHLGRIENASEKTATKMDDGFGVIAKGAAVAQLGVEAAMKAISVAFDAAASVVQGFADAIEMGGRLADLSKRTGEAEGSLLLLERAFENTGSKAEKVGPTINKLQKFIESASDESSKQAGILGELGTSYDELSGKAPIEQMRILGEKIAEIEDPGKRATKAIEIFGKSGGEILPFLTNFKDEVGLARNQLGSLPDIMTRSSEKFDELGDNIQAVKGKTLELAAGILEKALPAITGMTQQLSEVNAAKIGEELGIKIAEGLAIINNGDFWELFRLGGEKAITMIQTSDALNEFAATINTIWEGITNGQDFNFDEVWNKYRDAGLGANTEVIDEIDASMTRILDRAAEKVKAQQEELARNAAEQAAKSAIMLQDIQTKAGFTKVIPEWLRRVEGIPDITEAAKDDLSASAGSAAQVKANMIGAAMDLKDNTRDASDNMQQIRTLGDLIKAQDAAAPMKKFNEQVKEARADLKNLKDFIGGDFSRLSIPDIAKKLQIDTANKDQKELFEDIKKKLAELKGKEVDIKIDKDATKEDLDEVIKEIQARFEIFGEGSPLEINMTAEKSIVKIKESLKQEVDLALSSSKGTNILEALKAAVDVIKTTVQAIEPKLPQTALGV